MDDALTVTLGYYHPKAVPDITVTRTFTCKGGVITEVVNSDVTNKFEADRSDWEEFPLKALEGQMADADITFGYRDDGRLKSINSTSTGQGGEILKSVITMVTSLKASVFRDGREVPDVKKTADACAEIQNLNEGKAVTIGYSDKLTLDGKPQTLSVNRESEVAAATLSDYIGEVEVRSQSCLGELVGIHYIDVPQFGTEYPLPIPVARVFGKQTFALELAESGMITKLQYATEKGTNQAMGVANAAIPKESSAAERAKSANDQADEIAANIRLAKCLADPPKCE
ncbi:hypothetical protein [Lysobacter terrae]